MISEEEDAEHSAGSSEWIELLGSKVKKAIIKQGTGNIASYGNVVSCSYILYVVSTKDDGPRNQDPSASSNENRGGGRK